MLELKNVTYIAEDDPTKTIIKDFCDNDRVVKGRKTI